MNNLIVQKFGGTSVANTERFQAVADLVVDSINSGTNVAVVVSAMAGETQRLINLAKELQETPDPREYDALVSSGDHVSAALLAITEIRVILKRGSSWQKKTHRLCWTLSTHLLI